MSERYGDAVALLALAPGGAAVSLIGTLIGTLVGRTGGRTDPSGRTLVARGVKHESLVASF